MASQRKSSNPANPIQDILRLSNLELDAIEDELKEMPDDGRGRHLRRSDRVDLDEERIVVRLYAADAPTFTRFLVRPHDISETGLSFLHGCYVYAETLCTATLVRCDGASVDLPGRVKRCRFVSGRVHEVGVRFDNAIDLSQFVSPAIA